MISVSNAVNRRVKELLDGQNMSAYRLGKNAAIPNNTIKTLMRGANASVNLKTILQICRGLGIKTADFFSDPVFDGNDIDID